MHENLNFQRDGGKNQAKTKKDLQRLSASKLSEWLQFFFILNVCIKLLP